jgi:hypothetical protein
MELSHPTTRHDGMGKGKVKIDSAIVLPDCRLFEHLVTA